MSAPSLSWASVNVTHVTGGSPFSFFSRNGLKKTFVALAAALQLVFQREKRVLNTEIINSENNEVKRRGRKKKNPVDHNNNVKLHGHKKIFVVRPTTIIGEELGFLPGDLNEKIDPYFRPIKDLLIKLHEIRPCNKLFIDGDLKKGFDRSVIEFLPITYLRGMNLENAIVIVDE